MQSKLSVSQLNNYIKGVFDDELILKNIAVFGEVSECSTSAGNTFFTLRDDKSILHCVRFGAGFTPKSGDTVLAIGSVEYYAKGGRVTFRAKEIKPYGEGEIARALAELKRKLEAEGLFFGRPQPSAFIRKIAVVTSAEGAVIHDMLSVLARCPYVDVLLYPVRVQGEGSEIEIAEAVTRAATENNGCDAIVLARGGGSESDLAAFNTEVAARAVATSPRPVISAIGHETNYSLCDFCAGLRAGTPSIAAETICTINENFLAKFYSLAHRAQTAVRTKFRTNADRVSALTHRIELLSQSLYYKRLKKVENLVHRAENAISTAYSGEKKEIIGLLGKLSDGARDRLAAADLKFGAAVTKLNALNPLKLLEAGYARVYKGTQSVSGIDEISIGDSVNVVMSGGYASAEITAVRKNKE